MKAVAGATKSFPCELGRAAPENVPLLKKSVCERCLSMWKSIAAIVVGASLGAVLRWHLGIRLNSLFPTIPPGTLVANLVGAYVIGLAIAFFALSPTISPEWRLLVITGFCGGLTTFSTFSAEIVALLQHGQFVWACGAIAGHVVGSLLMTLAGIGTVYGLKSVV